MKTEFDFALTTYCQARCRSCARTNIDTGEKEDWLKLEHMDLNTYKEVLNHYLATRDGKDIRIIYCGELGDPLMHPDINEFVEYTAPRVKELVIKTNGGLRQPEWYTKIGTDYDNIIFHFGIDGTDHDTNWLYREGVNFERAMDNMLTWFRNGGRGEWQFLIFDWNWHQIPAAKQLATDNNIRIQFKFNNRHFGKITDENRKHAYDLLRSIDEI